MVMTMTGRSAAGVKDSDLSLLLFFARSIFAYPGNED